jgi:hypothetical protein
MRTKIASSMLILMMFISGCSVLEGETQSVGDASAPRVEGTQSIPPQESSQGGESSVDDLSYAVVDSGQKYCYADGESIVCPSSGQAYAGQDAQYDGNQPRYADNGNGTISDLNTGLMWQQDPGEKMTYDEAVAGADSFDLAGYDDWRLPTIKELYSLIDFSGEDPSGCSTLDVCPGIEAFMDTDTFVFEYGDTSIGDRVIDAQFISSTAYVGSDDVGRLVFGVNFADGRIKGYGVDPRPGQAEGKGFFVLYVRGATEYGTNVFVDNSDGTISDLATGLTWMQEDSGSGMLWEDALAFCENMTTAGYDDWRLPNAKELQSIVDYSRSPDTTNSAAIDPIFDATPITSERGEADYAYYWSSTTHASYHGGGDTAAYIAFGRSLGFMDNQWVDIHGAGSQRSDPKAGDPADYPTGRGPQGDAIRIFNYARCVRGGISGEMNSGGEVDPGAGSAASPPLGDGLSAQAQPPQEAIFACIGQSEGEFCSFQAPGGQITGTCMNVQGQLACVPEGGPPPPGG